MVKRHLTRLRAPTSWPLQRKKGVKWITRPHPGPHPLKRCITINLVLKSLLKYAKTTNETKKILNEGKVLIDKKARKDHKFPVGLMDVIEVPLTNECFRVLFNKNGKFMLHKISKEEAKLKPSKIVGKKILRGNKIQLNFYDGRNMLVDKNDYKVNDTVILDLSKEDNLIKKHLKFEKGALVYLIEGKHKGVSGVIEDVKPFFGNPTIIIKSKNKTFATSKDFAFIVDDSISLGE